MDLEVCLAQDKEFLAQAFELRHQVFVEEQRVPPELERDEDDRLALHVVALAGQEVVATGRLVIHGNQGKIGRMAVKKGWRGKGLGGKVLMKLLETGRDQGVTYFYLHAQLAVEPFYERLGFFRVGEIFEEAGIPHVRMEKKERAPDGGVGTRRQIPGPA